MFRVAIRFLAGRYHATPWDHHVNEGVPEWPPSPWRLQRALLSVLRQRGKGIEAVEAERAVLGLGPPRFFLPNASAAHTRHYLSLNQLERTKTTLTLDTFVTVSPETPVIVFWEEDLVPAEREALRLLFSRLTYLGRAESWCEARVLDENEDAPEPNCGPSDGSAAAGVETVRTLCAARDATVEDLERSTAELQDEGWSDPPGSRWVFYRRKAGLLGTRTRFGLRSISRPAVSVAEFTVGGLLRAPDEDAEPGCPEVTPVLPRVTRAVLVTSSLRGAALKRHDVPSVVLSGKGPEGRPLDLHHRHAHYLFDSRSGGDSRRVGKLTHLYVWAPGQGLGEREQEALERVQTLIFREGADRQMLRVVFSGVGEPGDFGAVSRVFAEVRVWRSMSPVLLPRHPKKNGKDHPVAQIRKELEERGFPAPVRIEIEKPRPGRIPWAEFETRRKAVDPTTGFLGFTIEFETPQRGPISLGRGGHFGLGQFEGVSR